MKNQVFFLPKYILHLILLAPIAAIFLNFSLYRSNSLLIADLNQEKDLHSSFDESNDSFFPSNPMELMNVLRSFESEIDSTPPSDAIDAAIEAFENQDQSFPSFDFKDN